MLITRRTATNVRLQHKPETSLILEYTCHVLEYIALYGVSTYFQSGAIERRGPPFHRTFSSSPETVKRRSRFDIPGAFLCLGARCLGWFLRHSLPARQETCPFSPPTPHPGGIPCCDWGIYDSTREGCRRAPWSCRGDSDTWPNRLLYSRSLWSGDTTLFIVRRLNASPMADTHQP